MVATLNTYVCVLRHSMFDDQAHARRVIVTGPGAYRLALEEVDLDLDRFDDLLLQAERAPRQERIRLPTAAVGLAGGPVLEHARYDEWVQEDRLLYEDRTTRAHLDLAFDWLVEGQRSTCLRHAELALSRDRYSEEAYRLVMLANHGLGRHDVVRRTLGTLPGRARPRPRRRRRAGDRADGRGHRGARRGGRHPGGLLPSGAGDGGAFRGLTRLFGSGGLVRSDYGPGCRGPTTVVLHHCAGGGEGMIRHGDVGGGPLPSGAPGPGGRS